MSVIFVMGLGSMGKRRIRCLKSLGFKKNDILGYDLRSDRREEVEQKYGVKTIASLGDLCFNNIMAFIVSLPPDQHALGANLAIDHDKPVFLEASVVLDDVLSIQAHNKSAVFVAPSCTLCFHSVIREIKKIIQSGIYGHVTNFSYHSGQYLPDWHPWEDVSDYYVSKRITGGAREIVPFELTWLVDILGFPQSVKGLFAKTIDCKADIEDSYAITLKYDYCIGTMVVDVASRYAVRNLVINLEEAQIQWRWDDRQMRLYNAKTHKWLEYKQTESNAADGYNINITEDMYVEEMKAFLAGISDRQKFPNTLEKDIQVLKLLKATEDSDGGFDR